MELKFDKGKPSIFPVVTINPIGMDIQRAPFPAPPCLFIKQPPINPLLAETLYPALIYFIHHLVFHYNPPPPFSPPTLLCCLLLLEPALLKPFTPSFLFSIEGCIMCTEHHGIEICYLLLCVFSETVPTSHSVHSAQRHGYEGAGKMVQHIQCSWRSQHASGVESVCHMLDDINGLQHRTAIMDTKC